MVAARGAVEVLEGDWRPQSMTALKFDDMEALKAWYESPDYAPLKQMRLESNIGDIIAIQGA